MSTTFRTARWALAVLISSLAVLSAGPAAADGFQGPTQTTNVGAWIKQTGLERHGTWARLMWTSNASTTTVQFSASPPKQVNGKWTFDAAYSSTPVSKQDGAFAYEASGLDPATTYYVVLTTQATPTLASTQATGQFTTKSRGFAVTFERIHVSDDADGAGRGAGDLWWWFKTSENNWSDGLYRKVSSGDSFTPTVNGLPKSMGSFVSNVPSITITVQGWDDDTSIWTGPCGASDGEWGGEPLQGSNECGDFAFAQTEFTFPTGTDEELPTPFEAPLSPGPTWLKFSVKGTVQAIYS